MKKAVALAVAVLMAAGIFSGCTLVKVDVEADGNRVVAVVNGEKILKKDWYSVYYMYYMYYGSSASEETLEQLKTIALDSLIYQTLWEQKAKEAGYFEFTDEQRAQAREEVEKEMEEEIQSKADEMKEAVEGQSGYENMEFYAEAKAASVKAANWSAWRSASSRNFGFVRIDGESPGLVVMFLAQASSICMVLFLELIQK